MRDLSRNSRLIRFILPVCLVFSVIACRDPDKKTLAIVGGSVITGREVETALGRPLSQLHQQIYTLQRQKLDELIDERLLSEEAKRRGVSVESLTEREVNAKILPVTDDEISALYNANKERIPVELDKVREQIRNLLRDQRRAAQSLGRDPTRKRVDCGRRSERFFRIGGSREADGPGCS